MDMDIDNSPSISAVAPGTTPSSSSVDSDKTTQCNFLQAASTMNSQPQPSAIQGFPLGVQLCKVDDRVGHGVFATKDFKKGEIIFMDSPIVSCQFAWNKMYQYKACDYCLRALETAEENARRLMQKPSIVLPFPECCETFQEAHVSCPECGDLYCCEECRVKAWNEFHSVLCLRTREPKESHPLVVLDTFWRMVHYPPETCNIILLLRLLVKLHFDKDHSLRNRLAQFCQGSKDENNEVAHKLLGEEYMDQINKLRLLVTSVISFDDIAEWLTPDGFIQLFVLIGRNGQGVGSSSFAVWVENVEKLTCMTVEEKAELMEKIDEYYHLMDGVVGHFLDNEGSALYPFQSWVNHSCVPNTEVKFPSKNHDIGLVAKRDIAAGEEITITYLDLGDMERSRYSRNKYLKAHYLFTCNCEKCEAQMGEDEVTSEEESDDEELEEEEDDDEDELEEIHV